MITNTTLTIPYNTGRNNNECGNNDNLLAYLEDHVKVGKLDDGLVSVSTQSSFVDTVNDNYSLQPYQVIHTFHNETDHDIVAINRNNISFFVPKSTSTRRGFGRKQHFGVRTSIVVRGNTYIHEFHQLLRKACQALPLSSNDLKKIEQLVREAIERNPHINQFHVAYDHVVDIERFGDCNDIYLADVDFLIVGSNDFGKTSHPFSEDRKTQKYLQECVGPREVAGILVEIVDNQRVMTKRFMTVGVNVVEVPIVTDPQRKDGVYRTLFSYELGMHRTNKTECFSFEEADEKIGLYRTKEEAIAGGDIDSKHKVLLKEKERELALLKHELEERKHELEERKLERSEHIDEQKYLREIDKLKQEKKTLKKNRKAEAKKHEREIARLEAQLELEKQKHEQEQRRLRYEIEKSMLENEKLKREHLINAQTEFYNMRKVERNDFYEERSHTRKEAFEWIKLAPALLTGIAALGGTMYAFARHTK